MPNEVEDFLAHYGVKGMKWGVRRERDLSSGGGKQTRAERRAARKAESMKPTEVETYQKKPGQFVKARGGANQAASADAIKTQTSRQKALASTTDSLSNKELQELVQRMNLEVQYQNLSRQVDRRSAGQQLASSILDLSVSTISGGSVNVSDALATSLVNKASLIGTSPKIGPMTEANYKKSQSRIQNGTYLANAALGYARSSTQGPSKKK